METKRSKVVIAAGLLIMSLTMACNSALAPILAEVGKSFSEAGDANIQIVLTLINLITLPMMLLEPRLERFMTKPIVKVKEIIQPNDEWAKVYDELYPYYVEMYKHLDQDLKALRGTVNKICAAK